MKTKLTLKLLVGAVALTAAGSVFANTSLKDGNATGGGSLFLNVVDTTNSTSFVFDTGLTLSSFTGNSPLTYNLSTDANWNSFLTGAGSDALQYNVVGVTTNAAGGQYNVAFTSNAATGTSVGKVGSTSNGTLQSVANLNPFIAAINASTSSTSNSLYVQDTGANANDAAYFGNNYSIGGGFTTTTTTSGIKDIYAAGTATKFYELSPNGDINNISAKALVTAFAGTWNLVGSTLSYTVSSVPLPDSLGLLLGGVALMGLIARRGKSNDAAGLPGAAA